MLKRYVMLLRQSPPLPCATPVNTGVLPRLGTEHQLPHQESTRGCSTAAEEIQPAKDNDGALLWS